MWEVCFPEPEEIQEKGLTTALTVYALPKNLIEKFRMKRKQLAGKLLGSHHGTGVLL